MARSASASAMAGAGLSAGPQLPPVHTDERWGLRGVSAEAPRSDEPWPTRDGAAEIHSSSDWKAQKTGFGDYAPSVEADPVFRPLDQAIAKTVLGAAVSADIDPSEPAETLSHSEAELTGSTLSGSDTSGSGDEADGREKIDPAALTAALWRVRAATEGKVRPPFPPSLTDETVRLKIQSREVEPGEPSDIYGFDSAALAAARGAEGWQPTRKSGSETQGESVRPFRPIGDLSALARTRWGIPAIPPETLDETVTDQNSNDPIIDMDAEVPSGRLWGPAVALPLPSAVAADALSGRESSTATRDILEDFDADGSDVDETAFAIGMDNGDRPDHLAEAADELASQSEPANEESVIPELEESEMQQVAADDEALASADEVGTSTAILAPGPAEDEEPSVIESDFEPILKGRGTPAPSPDDPRVSPEEPQPIDLLDQPVPESPPAGTEDRQAGDDLSRIKGVGPATEQRLHELGVTRYAQIAAWGPEEATWFGEQLFFPGRVERENWIELARQLVEEQTAQN
ncbi:hypothetical protein [Notoacmeibacter sp. MSK16QG-6]|uniref:hypothetical protein n=1 Tax=Notoacmeibacter sp. MSK16QG-6 TaxID=2957982 RepID=UPI00209FD7E5|nr:hypothetical protein [Notoacmeibacter sp. MSK16QG-6]MCP1198043.1 hypothetical protein [Notoacmeibacter sp. MSK16QG-6]